MKRLFAFLALCLPIYLFAQGFGSFTHDQPYFATDRGGEPVFPGVQPTLAYWWHASDISSNDPVSIWYDRIAGYPLIQNNVLFQPTNSSSGLCFDGTKQIELSPTLKIPTNSSFFISGYFSTVPHSQCIVYSTNTTEGLTISPTNQLVVTYASTKYDYTSLGNNTNLVDIVCTTEKDGANVKIVAYLNGTQTSSNYLAGNGASLDLIGGWSGYFGGDQGWLDYSLYAYITDIMVWTNLTITADNVTWLHNWNAYTNSPTKDPFWNPSDYGTVVEWWRGDNPSIGYTSGGGPGGHTNGMDALYSPESCNLADDVTLKLTGSIPTPIKWFSAVGTSGRPAIMNTGNSALNCNNPVSETHSQPTIFFSVVQSTNNTVSQSFFDSFASGVNLLSVYDVGGNSMRLNAGSDATFVRPLSITNTTVVTSCFNGTNSFVRTNGVSVTFVSGNSGTDAFKRQIIVGNDASLTTPLKGYYYELIGFELGSMTTNDIQSIENTLKSKYGIP